MAEEDHVPAAKRNTSARFRSSNNFVSPHEPNDIEFSGERKRGILLRFS
jgi:hypothetical protein